MKKIFLIIGASGSGKTTLGKELIKKTNMSEVVSTTTRLPRPGEVEGETYYFIKPKDYKFEDFIQHANYTGNDYGITKKSLKNAFNKSDNVFIIISRDSIDIFKKLFKEQNDVEIITVFLQTTKEVVEKRMIKRGDTKENINKRLLNASQNKEFEIPNDVDYVIDSSKTIDDMYNDFIKII